jgi:hypothetical protein
MVFLSVKSINEEGDGVKDEERDGVIGKGERRGRKRERCLYHSASLWGLLSELSSSSHISCNE